MGVSKGCDHADANKLTFPDVQLYIQPRRVQKDTQRNEKHVGDNVIQPQDHKAKDGKPHANDLGGEVLGLHPEEQREADEPVAPDGAQEDLVPLGLDLCLRHKGDDVGPVRVFVEHAAIYEGQLRTRHWGEDERDLHPKMMAMTKRAPARLPKKQNVQWYSIFQKEMRPWINAADVTGQRISTARTRTRAPDISDGTYTYCRR